MKDLNIYRISPYSQYFYYAAYNHNIDVLLAASLALFSKRSNDSYFGFIYDIAANEYITYIVDWFNEEAFEYFMSYYAKQKKL